nr:immunoglobulin heavy chain junction region [Mus musculus]MBK4197603.1 immunoglobulin heavy chain junction region [Mus musculus]
CAWAMDYW